MNYWIALFVAVIANIGANIAFKHFLESSDLKWTKSAAVSAALHPSLWIGVGLGVTLLVSYLAALRGLPISVAYTTATTLSIAGITALGVLFYSEPFGWRMALGVATVVVGVLLITTS